MRSAIVVGASAWPRSENESIAPWARSTTPGYANSGNKFDLTKWDEAYFKRLKSFLSEADKLGVRFLIAAGYQPEAMIRVMEVLKKVVKDAGFTVSAIKVLVREVTVVKADDGKITLTMKGSDQKHIHDVAKDSTITLDDKKAKLEELKNGFSANVTINDKLVITNTRE